MTEWIKCSDRLPSKEDKFIAVLVNNIPHLAHVTDSSINLIKNSVIFYWPKKEWLKDAYYSFPTHWMPLPLLPIEVEE